MSNPKGHHILSEKWQWEAKGRNGVVRPAQKLRRMSGLIVPELHNTEEHNQIHRQLGHVAIPSYIATQGILARYRDNPADNLHSVDNLIEAGYKTIEETQMPDMQAEIVHLMLKNVEAQIPYIEAVL